MNNIVEILQKFDQKKVAIVERNGMANRSCQTACSGEVDPLITYFTDDGWFHLKGHINTQNKRYWSADNPRLI